MERGANTPARFRGLAVCRFGFSNGLPRGKMENVSPDIRRKFHFPQTNMKKSTVQEMKRFEKKIGAQIEKLYRTGKLDSIVRQIANIIRKNRRLSYGLYLGSYALDVTSNKTVRRQELKELTGDIQFDYWRVPEYLKLMSAQKTSSGQSRLFKKFMKDPKVPRRPGVRLGSHDLSDSPGKVCSKCRGSGHL
jgi:hypothetical protein